MSTASSSFDRSSQICIIVLLLGLSSHDVAGVAAAIERVTPLESTPHSNTAHVDLSK